MSAAFSRGSFYATPSTSSNCLVVQQQTQAQSVTVGGLGIRAGSAIFLDKKKVVDSVSTKKSNFLDAQGLMFDMELDPARSRGIARRGSEDCLSGFINSQKNRQNFNFNPASASAENYIRLLTRSHSHLEDQLRKCILDISFCSNETQQKSLQQFKFELENRGFKIEIVAEQTQLTEQLNQGKIQKPAICYPHSYLTCKGVKNALDGQQNFETNCRASTNFDNVVNNTTLDSQKTQYKQKKYKISQEDLSNKQNFEKILFEKDSNWSKTRNEAVVIIDPFFQQQFEVATTMIQPEYLSLLSAVPQVFVGTQQRLKKVVEKICREMQISFQKCKIPLPPWRCRSNMLAKWQLQDVGGGGGGKKGRTQFGEKMKELVKMDQDREFAKFSEFVNAVKQSGYQQHMNLKTSNCEVDGYEGDSECEQTKPVNGPRNLKEGQLSFALKRIPGQPPALQKPPTFLASQIQKTCCNISNQTPVQPKSKSLLSSAVKKLVGDGKSPDSVLVHQQQQERPFVLKNALQPVKSTRMFT